MQLGFIRNGKIIQIKEIAEIPVMPDGLCTPPPPPTHTNTFFSWVGTLLAHPAQTTSGTRESWKPIQKLLRQRDCSKLIR